MAALHKNVFLFFCSSCRLEILTIYLYFLPACWQLAHMQQCLGFSTHYLNQPCIWQPHYNAHSFINFLYYFPQACCQFAHITCNNVWVFPKLSLRFLFSGLCYHSVLILVVFSHISLNMHLQKHLR